MDWYFSIALAAIVLELLFLNFTFKNYRFALHKYQRPRTWYRPRTTLLVPCKGVDSDFQRNITSFFDQEYENYILWFVVEAESDPAYETLCRLKEQLAEHSKAQDVQIFIAGQSESCSQKIHNLLHCYENIPDDIEVIAFADSDACVRRDWLSHIVYPLHQEKIGAASGYRWFVPQTNNLATLALSAVNAKIAQLLGNSRFNQAWGGSMAIRVEVFRQLGLDKIWPKAISDDFSLTCAVKRAGKKIAFVPACLVASYETTTWAELFEFGRRQFVITRVSALTGWIVSLSCSLFSVLGLWAGLLLAVFAANIDHRHQGLYIAVPVIFFMSQLARAILRQKMIGKLLEKDLPRMKTAMVADILFFWVWSLLLLFFIIASAFGRTITWRGIRYKLRGPTEIIVINGKGAC